MEVSTIMTSSVQMQQVFPEITPGDETGNLQSNLQQSVCFSELFDLCAGTGNGLRKSTDPLAAVAMSKAIAPPVQASRQLPGQQVSDLGLIQPELAAGFLQVASPSESSLTETLAEPKPEDDADVYTQALDAYEPVTEPARTYIAWALPFVPGKTSMEVDSAQPLPEQRTMVSSPTEKSATHEIAEVTGAKTEASVPWVQNSELERKQVSPQPGYPEKTAQGAAFPGSTGKVLLQESQVKVEQQAEPSIITPEPLVNMVSEVTPGRNLAPLSGPDVSASTAEFGVPSRPSIFRETSLYRAISQGVESSPEGDAGTQGKSIKPGTDVAVPQSEVNSRSTSKTGTDATILQPETAPRAGGEILLPPAQGEYADVTDRESFAAPATAPETPFPGENRRAGETAVNAYRVVTSEAVTHGKKGDALFNGNIRPSTSSEMPVADTANSEEAPHLIDMVFSGKGKSLTMGAGREAAGKAEEVKPAGMENPTVFVQGQGELRSNGENRAGSPANEAKHLSPGQIHQQIREKLESGDYGLNKGNITLKLHPEELGELKINLRMEDQRLKIEIMTENPSVKDALMQNLDTLKDTLSRQNIAMERFNVSTDIRHGFQQGGRDERQLMQGGRGSNAVFQPATADEDPALSKFLYGWDNDNSLVSLVL